MEEMQIEANAKLSSLIEKFELLEAALASVTRENETLKVTVAEQAVQLAEIRNRSTSASSMPETGACEC